MSASHRLDTQLIHAGEPRPRIGGAAVLPIFQTTVFEFGDVDESPDGYHGIPYPRLSNLPNHIALGDKLAALEGAEAAFVTASGMAAISTALLTVAAGGGHVLAQNCLYGGTISALARTLPNWGVSHDMIDPRDPGSWAKKLKPNTKAIYVEALTNPTLDVIDHRAVVDFADSHGLVSLVDSTFATPVNFKPPALGYDLSLHSATKYLNGHTDLAAGAVIGKAELVRKVKHNLDHLGGALDPLGCFLLQRGMRTLALRVRHQNASAERMAAFLAAHPKVARVNYPSLPSHPQHELARELFTGFGGVLSFEPKGGAAAAEKIVKRVDLAINGPSLGGTETLMSIPARLSHASLTDEERALAGVTPGLIRLSLGIEDPDDLIEDFGRALESL